MDESVMTTKSRYAGLAPAMSLPVIEIDKDGPVIFNALFRETHARVPERQAKEISMDPTEVSRSYDKGRTPQKKIIWVAAIPPWFRQFCILPPENTRQKFVNGRNEFLGCDVEAV
jgi:hypothetical protein